MTSSASQPEPTILRHRLVFEEAAIPIVLIRGNHQEKFATLPPFLSPLPHLDLDGIRIVHDPRPMPRPLRFISP